MKNRRWLILLLGGVVLAGCGGEADAAVSVKLNSFSVIADKTEVGAGRVRFSARNDHGSEVHELAVLRVKPDGSFESLGEIEDLGPGKSGSIAIDLTPGKYLLACLIVPGETGSNVDHLGQGMRRDFQVK